MTKPLFQTSIAVLFAGLLLAASAGFNNHDEPIMMENQSAYNFDTTVEQFEKAVDQAGWSIITSHNMKQMLQRHGHEILEVEVFELCSAKYSAKILALDDERVISPLMPCRVSIYKKSDGYTYISRMDNKQLARPYGGVVKDVMTRATDDIEDILSGIIR